MIGAGSPQELRVPPPALVATDAVSKYFAVSDGLFSPARRVLRAVDGVSIRVPAGETVGLVGESGCGKSTLGRLILHLVDPTFGRVYFDGQDITALAPRHLRPLRRRMQVIFQDPYSSLNPRMTVRDIVGEGIRIHRLAGSRREEGDRIMALLDRVGLRPDTIDELPHALSGGQRQRVGIARALAVEPRFIVCDEPVSALDVSVQGQIVNLLLDLQEKLGLAYLFISHDLRLVGAISHRLAVMVLGRIVEQGSAAAVYERPMHPYTAALFAATPSLDPAQRRLRLIAPGDIPSAIHPPSGCSFHPRCPRALPGLCDVNMPPLDPVTPDGEHDVACWNPVPS